MNNLLMWEIKCLKIFKSAAPSPGKEKEKEDEVIPSAFSADRLFALSFLLYFGHVLLQRLV